MHDHHIIGQSWSQEPPPLTQCADAGKQNGEVSLLCCMPPPVLPRKKTVVASELLIDSNHLIERKNEYLVPYRLTYFSYESVRAYGVLPPSQTEGVDRFFLSSFQNFTSVTCLNYVLCLCVKLKPHTLSVSMPGSGSGASLLPHDPFPTATAVADDAPLHHRSEQSRTAVAAADGQPSVRRHVIIVPRTAWPRTRPTVSGRRVRIRHRNMRQLVLRCRPSSSFFPPPAVLPLRR